MGGTRVKPMIACANKECGYKRPVGEPGEGGEVGAAAGEGEGDGRGLGDRGRRAGVALSDLDRERDTVAEGQTTPHRSGLVARRRG